MNRDEFVSKNRIEDALASWGVKVVPGKVQQDVRCPFHEDKTASMSVNTAKQVWHCQVGCGGGSVIDLLAKRENISAVEVLKRSGVNGNGKPTQPSFAGKPDWKTVCAYDYTDELGGLLYQVVRMHSDTPGVGKGYEKTFRQRQPDNKGGWNWTMEGAVRVLYRLPEIVKSKSVFCVEGEKDADTLAKLGFCSTTSLGGAGKWLDAYSDYLAGKEVIICGDNDDTGQKHAKTIFDSVAGKAKNVKMVKLPTVFKDVSDFVESFKEKADALRALQSMCETAAPFTKGIMLPIYSLYEIEPRYVRMVKDMGNNAVDLGKWIPTLGQQVRHLVPGEVAVILADTGVGKTACLQNLASKLAPLPVLLFELELPDELLFERFVAGKTKMRCRDVEQAYRAGDVIGEDGLAKSFAHIFVCAKSRLSLSDIETFINHAELKIGQRPRVVMIDYMGLVATHGSSRYDKLSRVAEELKIIAKTCQVVMICASQVHRPYDDDAEPGLHDAKDSGSIECSAGLVIGVWRDPEDESASTLLMKVLKQTKGRPGCKIVCNFDGERCLITERTKISDEDIPQSRNAYAD